MKKVMREFLLSVMLLGSPHAQAETLPSFDLEHCAWHATDIVVASEGDTIDGELSALTVLSGGLKIGDSVSVPELGQFRLKESRTVRSFRNTSDDKEHPLVLTGERMMVFLKRGEGKTGSGPNWGPASPFFAGMDVSVVWIANGHVYGFTQVRNPGPPYS